MRYCPAYTQEHDRYGNPCTQTAAGATTKAATAATAEAAEAATAASYNSGTKGRKIMRFKWAAPWVFTVCQAEYCEDKQVKKYSRARYAVDRIAS